MRLSVEVPSLWALVVYLPPLYVFSVFHLKVPKIQGFKNFASHHKLEPMAVKNKGLVRNHKLGVKIYAQNICTKMFKSTKNTRSWVKYKCDIHIGCFFQHEWARSSFLPHTPPTKKNAHSVRLLLAW